MLPIYRYLLVAFASAAVLLILRYGYVAATEIAGAKKARATLVATLGFASFFVVLPLLWLGYEAQLPVFEFDGVIESVRVETSSNKHYSAWLSILTSLGGTITVHVSGRSEGWSSGQHLKVRYYGYTAEMIQATFFDASGKEQGQFHGTSWMLSVSSIVIGAYLIWAACVQYKRAPMKECSA